MYNSIIEKNSFISHLHCILLFFSDCNGNFGDVVKITS